MATRRRRTTAPKESILDPLVIVRRFPTWESAVDKAAEETGAPGRNSRKNRGDSDWSGSRDFPEALALARNGWNEGTDRIREIMAPLVDHLAARIDRQTFTYDVAGDFPDIGRFLAGEPENMVCFTTEETTTRETNRTARILVNLSTAAHTSGEQMTARGSLIAALTDLAEIAGVSVTLDIAAGSAEYQRKTGFMDRHYILATIKDAGQPLDESILAFSLCHPASFRRIMFGIWDSEPESIRDRFGFRDEGGYGIPDAYRPDEGYDLIITENQGYGDDPETFILEALATLGITTQKGGELC